MQTTVLVTGANGQLGRELRDIAKADESFSWVFTDVEELNITIKEEIVAYTEKHNPAFIINCAAYTAVDKAESDQESALKLNVDAVEYLSEECKKRNIVLVHISTDYVFDGLHHKPYKENHPLNPNGFYSTTKAMGEQRVKDSGCKHLILRTSWLYSSYGHNFLKTISRLAKERESLNVVFDQTGSPTYAFELADAIVRIMIKVQNEDGLYGTYHVSNEGVCSWFDFATEIVNAGNYSCRVHPIETHEYPLPSPRPYYSVMNKSLLRKTFGIEMSHWREAMLRCLKKLSQNE